MKRKVIYGLFVFYLLALTWVILFKLGLSPQDLPHIRDVNLVPFGACTVINGKPALSEVFYNVLAFVPFGVYLCMIKNDGAPWKKLALLAGTSLLFEVLQFAFAIGATDITDLLANTLGGLLGIGVYRVSLKVLRDVNRTNTVWTVLAAVCTALLAVQLGLLIALN